MLDGGELRKVGAGNESNNILILLILVSNIIILISTLLYHLLFCFGLFDLDVGVMILSSTFQVVPFSFHSLSIHWLLFLFY